MHIMLSKMGAMVVNSTVQKMKFSITDFFSKCDQTRSYLRIWSHLMRKSIMENLTLCAVRDKQRDFQFAFT